MPECSSGSLMKPDQPAQESHPGAGAYDGLSYTGRCMQRPCGDVVTRPSWGPLRNPGLVARVLKKQGTRRTTPMRVSDEVHTRVSSVRGRK